MAGDNDINLKGGDINNGGNLQILTINGESINDTFGRFYDIMKNDFVGAFASSQHVHTVEDIVGMEDVLASLLAKKIDEPEEASPPPSFNLEEASGVLPLSHIQNGDRIKEFIEHGMPEPGHTMNDLERENIALRESVSELTRRVTDLQKNMEMLPGKFTDMMDIIQLLRQRIDNSN